jgi:hypothetical protein
MDTDGWQPIDTAPPETSILLGRVEGGQLKYIALGRISKLQYGKPIEYQWHYTVAPTHWKSISSPHTTGPTPISFKSS